MQSQRPPARVQALGRGSGEGGEACASQGTCISRNPGGHFKAAGLMEALGSLGKQGGSQVGEMRPGWALRHPHPSCVSQLAQIDPVSLLGGGCSLSSVFIQMAF